MTKPNQDYLAENYKLEERREIDGVTLVIDGITDGSVASINLIHKNILLEEFYVLDETYVAVSGSIDRLIIASVATENVEQVHIRHRGPPQHHVDKGRDHWFVIIAIAMKLKDGSWISPDSTAIGPVIEGKDKEFHTVREIFREPTFTNKWSAGTIIAANKDIVDKFTGKVVITKDCLYIAGHPDQRGFWMVGDNGVSTIYNPDDFRRGTAASC